MSVPQSDQMADQFDAVRPAQNTPGEKRRAALLACAYAGRGLNLDDPIQLRAAAQLAEPLIDALGLNGRPVRVNSGSGGERLSPTQCGEQCETAQGYWRHVGRGEKTCRASRDAYNAYKRAQAGDPR